MKKIALIFTLLIAITWMACDETVQNSVPVQGSMLASGSYTINVDDANATISDIYGMLCDYQFQNNNETLDIGCQVVVDGPLYTLIRGNN